MHRSRRAAAAVGRIRLLIAGDRDVFSGLRSVLADGRQLTIVAHARDEQSVHDAIRLLTPDIVIVDADGPSMSALALQLRIRGEQVRVETIFLTGDDDQGRLDAALDAGVRGYLLRPCEGREIARCIAAVVEQRHYVSPSMTSDIVRRHTAARNGAALDQLTRQERAVFARIGEHKSSKEIAAELGIAPRTVDTHRLSMCKKLGVHGNYGLTRFAGRHRHGA